MGYTWQAIADELGFGHRQAAKSAVERLWARTRDSPEMSRRSLSEGMQLMKTMLFEQVAVAVQRGDADLIVTLSRELRSVTDQLARIDGLHAARRVEVDVTQRTTVEVLADLRQAMHAAIDAEVVETREIEQ
ncbi:hypothetical protein [Mycolicibacterium moriokaense]|uniref:hypothetical protein n=1 Tax=Mycolicibacterium moriokaense TaxID=39691 RepID=UPI001056AED8|nr:hypothetical protein [Mycolicibacterium moriokaense]MCV7037465.1 hypothetical protein [Mycolicibacterium moriokaense]